MFILTDTKSDTDTDLDIYNAIHQAAGLSSTGRKGLQRPFSLSWLFFHSTGIVPVKARNGSAGGLVNSAVRLQFIICQGPLTVISVSQSDSISVNEPIDLRTR